MMERDEFLFATTLTADRRAAIISLLSRRRGREVEGTPLLREHTCKTGIEGSNPSVSAKDFFKALIIQGFFVVRLG